MLAMNLIMICLTTVVRKHVLLIYVGPEDLAIVPDTIERPCCIVFADVRLKAVVSISKTTEGHFTVSPLF